MNDKTKQTDETPADVEAITAEIQRLRTDLTSLVDTVGKVGRSRARGLAKSAEGKANDSLAAGEAMLNDVRSELERLEHDLATATRRSPFRALGIAAACGFLVALILRR